MEQKWRKDEIFRGDCFIPVNTFGFSGKKILPSCEKMHICLIECNNIEILLCSSKKKKKLCFQLQWIFLHLVFYSLSLSKKKKNSPGKLCLQLQNRWNSLPSRLIFCLSSVLCFCKWIQFLRRMQNHWIIIFSISYFNAFACFRNNFAFPWKTLGLLAEALKCSFFLQSHVSWGHFCVKNKHKVWGCIALSLGTCSLALYTYSYVTHEDICDAFSGDTLLAVMAPSGTQLEVPVPEMVNMHFFAFIIFFFGCLSSPSLYCWFRATVVRKSTRWTCEVTQLPSRWCW